MNDLIYRNQAIDAVSRGCKELRGIFADCEKNLNELPSAEPEIVRCEDCKHLFDGEHNANCCEVLMRKAKWLTEITVDMNWYCADGERRRGE